MWDRDASLYFKKPLITNLYDKEHKIQSILDIEIVEMSDQNIYLFVLYT
jgi:hypothetical protein